MLFTVNGVPGEVLGNCRLTAGTGERPFIRHNSLLF